MKIQLFNLKQFLAQSFASFETNNRYSSPTEFEGHPTTNVKNLPWSPLYCVLQQDEQTYTAYCSEELSVSLSLSVRSVSNLKK